jgi:hypothetical protein
VSREIATAREPLVSVPVQNALIIADDPVGSISIYSDRAHRRWQEANGELPELLLEFLQGDSRYGRTCYDSFSQKQLTGRKLQRFGSDLQVSASLLAAASNNTCKHSGAVLPFPSAPVGRGVDGIDAMA